MTIRQWLLGASAIAALGVADQAAAQQAAGQDGSEVEAVIVTAQRREESLQEIPIAVTAIGEDAIKRAHAQNLTDFTRSAPNFTIEAVGSVNRSSAVIYSRGIGFGGIDVVEPPVAVSIDGLFYAVNTGTLHNVFDVKRIEILQGPQGTLFGRNSTGGVLQIVTNDPTKEFEGSGQVRYGTYGRFDTNLTVNVPLGENLAARLSVNTQYSDGVFTNLYVDPASGQRTGDDQSTGGDNTQAARAKLLFTPSDQLRVLLTGWYTRQRQDSPVGVNAAGPGDLLFSRGPINANSTVVGRPGIGLPGGPTSPFVINRDSNGVDNITTYGTVLDATYDTGMGFDVTSITGYYKYRSHQATDFDGSDLFFFHTNGFGRRYQLSQEIRLASNTTDSPLTWQGGVFFFKTKYNGKQVNVTGPFFRSAAGNLPPNNQFLGSEVRNNSVAGFFQADYKVMEQLTLTAGGRYIHEKKSVTLWPVLPNLNEPFTAATLQNSETWNDFIYRLAARYEVNDDLNFYVSWSTGTKAGGFSTAATTLSQLEPYKPERAKSLEGGMRSEWLDRKLRLNVTLFSTKYSDLQVGAFRPVAGGSGQQSFTANAAFERAKGVEVSATALPIPNLRLSASVGYLDAYYTSFKAALSYNFPGHVCNGLTAGPGSPPIIQDHSDKASGCFLEPVRAPKWTGKLEALYDIQIGDIGTLTPHAAWSFEGSHYTNLTNAPQGFQGKYSIWDADLTFEDAADRYRLSFYAKNITNKTHLLNANPIAGLFTVNYYALPRTYGVELGVKF